MELLKYPPACFEVIFVNDFSTDETLKILQQFQTRTKLKCTVLSLKQGDEPGKKSALAFGVKQAANQHIFITDADCSLSPDVLKYYSAGFTSGNDVLFGPAPFIQHGNVINTLSCYEQFRNGMLTRALANSGVFYTATARNFGYTRHAFDKIQGYSGTRERIGGDDDLFIREAVEFGLRIAEITALDACVFSETAYSLSTYLRQRARHVSTSHVYSRKNQVILFIWHAINYITLFSFLCSFISPVYWLPTFAKLMCDITLTGKFQGQFSYQFPYTQRIFLPFLHEISVLIHFINSLFKKRAW
ncbi:MAG: glycosyltransferase [Ignavibacteria bacterium]|nr:glycosyltransferase [Ignavibacteria bacterium]